MIAASTIAARLRSLLVTKKETPNYTFQFTSMEIEL